MGSWTYGALANHIEKVAGDNGRARVSSTFLQPFLSYAVPGGTTLSLNTESTYDWNSNEGSVPVNLVLAKVSKIGGQMVQYGVGLRYWAESTEAGPEGMAVRLNLVLLYPR